MLEADTLNLAVEVAVVFEHGPSLLQPAAVNGCHVTRESGGERVWVPELRATGDDGSGVEIGVIVLR